MIIACKKCKKVFRRPPVDQWEESDEFCPHCDTHLVTDSVEERQQQLPKGMAIVKVEGDGEMFDARVKSKSTQLTGVELTDEEERELTTIAKTE